MELSIVILNYKTKGLLKQCLKGIYLYPPSVSYEVIVVDNNSGDGSVELVREQFPKVVLLPQHENLGYHKGNNIGIKAARGKYIMILNTDIAFLDNSLDKMYQFMEAHPQVALMGPKLKNPDGSIQASCLRFPNFWVPILRRTFLGKYQFAKSILSQYLMTDFDHQTTRRVDWILGACIIVRRDAIDRVGMMDEDLFLYFGDIAWCRSFWAAGYQVFYFVDTHIVHYHQRESAQSGIFSKIFWIHIKDWFKYLKKYSTHNVRSHPTPTA
jgi:GT2 family glycosyltransferase